MVCKDGPVVDDYERYWIVDAPCGDLSFMKGRVNRGGGKGSGAWWHPPTFWCPHSAFLVSMLISNLLVNYSN